MALNNYIAALVKFLVFLNSLFNRMSNTLQFDDFFQVIKLSEFVIIKRFSFYLCLQLLFPAMNQESLNLAQQSALQIIEDTEQQIEEQDKSQGRWEEDQHHRFLQGLFKYGKNWKEIQAIVSTRICSQVRSHAQKYFIKLQKIIKDRKKQKNKLTELTDIEKQILDKFSKQDITNKTPQILVSLIRNECLLPKSKESEKGNVAALQIPSEHDKEVKKATKYRAKESQEKNVVNNQKQRIVQEEQNQIQKSDNIISSYYENGQYQDKSFFRRLMQHNVEHFRQGKDFIDFIDLDRKHNEEVHKNEQMQSSETTRNRRSSFTLVDEIMVDQKRKEALQKLKSGQKC